MKVLAYHGIDDPACFERQVAYLAAHYEPVGEADVLDSVRNGTPLPERAVLVTFDDGERSLLEHGAGVLARHGVPGVAYIVAGLLDTDTPFWWSEVEHLVLHGGRAEDSASTPAAEVRRLKRLPEAERLRAIEALRATATEPAPPMPQLRRAELAQLVAHGISVGNHTLTHPCLDQCEDGGVLSELQASQQILAEVLGAPPRSIAYPNGNVDRRTRDLAAEVGFELGFLFDHRVGPWAPPDPLRVSRLRVNSTTPMGRFRAILSGVHPAVHHALGRG